MAGVLKGWVGSVAIVAALTFAPAIAVADHGLGQAVRAAGGAKALADAAASGNGGERSAVFKAAAQTPGSLELVGHSPLLARGMNAAPAVHGNYVYVGSRTDGTHANAGVLVVDVSDPADPQVVNEIRPPFEGNPGETSRELRVWPEQELLLVLNHGCSSLIHRCVGAEAGTVRSTIRFYDISGANAANPQLVSTFFPSRSRAQIPHEFFLWDDPLRPGRALLYYTNPSGSDQELIVADISGARQGEFSEIEEFKIELPDNGLDNRLHSLGISNDGTRGYVAHLGGGFLVIDTSDLAAASPNPEVRLITPVENRPFWGDPGAHSAVKLFGRPNALVTDEVYGKLGAVLPAHGCPWGWVRMIDIADETRPRINGEYRVSPHNFEPYCEEVPPDQENFSSQSAHNPTLTPNLALTTWHSRGFQVFSIERPARPQQLAEFVPEPLPVVQTEDPALSTGRDKVVMWSYPIVKDGLIYVVDLRNGLYVLRYHGRCEDELNDVAFLEGNSNLGDALRFEGSAQARSYPGRCKRPRKKPPPSDGVTGADARRLRGPLPELAAPGGFGSEGTLERD